MHQQQHVVALVAEVAR
ncbi:hypothetical protein, partial [Metapseudomonas otitidis]